MVRTDIINHIIQAKHYTSYLEIGLGGGLNFNNIIIPNKVGVDPSIDPVTVGFTIQKTSNEFFQFNKDKFELIFIDGLHLSEQTFIDIENSLKVLLPNGMILVHDCMPFMERHQRREQQPGDWTGDVWKAFAQLRATRTDLFMFTIAKDWGIGVIRRGEQELYEGPRNTFEDFQTNKCEMMNIVPWFIAKVIM